MANDDTKQWNERDHRGTSEEIAEQHFREALRLIKQHITEDETPQNVDLHNAVQHLVRGARKLGLLEPGSGSTNVAETIL